MAAITYYLGRDGIYINFLGTLDALYDSNFFGDKATNKIFGGMGLATLLIRAIQYQAYILGYKKIFICNVTRMKSRLNNSIVY